MSDKNDGEIAEIRVKELDTRHLSGAVFVIGAADGPPGLSDGVEAGVSALNNPGVKEAHDRVDDELDASDFDVGDVIVRIHPDGSREWLVDGIDDRGVNSE